MKNNIVTVISLFRHGDRTFLSNTGWSQPNTTLVDWTFDENSGYGQLTQDGIEQHHHVGRKMRERYINDGDDKNHHFFHVRTTDYDRTQQSVGAQLRTLTNLTIPIHTVENSEEHLLRGMAGSVCHHLHWDHSNSEKTYKDGTVYDVSSAGDQIGVTNAHPNLKPYLEYNDDLREWLYYEYKAALIPNLSRERNHLGAGALASEIVRILRTVTQGGKWSDDKNNFDESLPRPYPIPEDPKMVLYSAHDTTIDYLRVAMGLPIIPPTYAAQLVFEIDNNHCLTVWFNNDLEKMFTDKVKICDKDCCSYADLEKMFEDYGAMWLSLHQIKEACAVPPPTSSKVESIKNNTTPSVTLKTESLHKEDILHALLAKDTIGLKQKQHSKIHHVPTKEEATVGKKRATAGQIHHVPTNRKSEQHSKIHHVPTTKNPKLYEKVDNIPIDRKEEAAAEARKNPKIIIA